MIIKVSCTSVVYSVYRPDDDNPEIARKCMGELNIYDGKATEARIAREIPKGATVEGVRKINHRFEVDGEKAISWLTENGNMKE